MFKLFNNSNIIFGSLFAIKILSAFALTAVYTYYYTDRSTADIFKYFDDAKIIYQQLPESPNNYLSIVAGIDTDSPEIKTVLDRTSYWYKAFDYRLYNDNRTIIRINAIFMLFSFGSFAVHNVFFAFLSFIGLYAIFRIFHEIAPHKRYPLLFAVFCIPSVLFWGSGVLKESFLLFLFGTFLFITKQLISKPFVISRKSLFFLISIPFLLIALCLTKYYVILCAIPALILWMLCEIKHYKLKHAMWATTAIYSTISIALIINQNLIHGYNIIETLQLKHNDFVNMALSVPNTGSLVETFHLKASISDFLRHTPWAFSKSFLQPFPWQINSFPMLLASLENVLFILLIILLLVLFDRTIKFQAFTLFCLLFIIALMWLNGLITPVLGALVRYKVPALPFLYALLVLYIDFKRIPIIKQYINAPINNAFQQTTQNKQFCNFTERKITLQMIYKRRFTNTYSKPSTIRLA